MINNDQLENCFSKSYNFVQKKVDQRHKEWDYDWIIQSQKQIFYPDYFTLNYIGKYWPVRLFGSVMSQFGVFGISYKAMRYFVDLFYQSQESTVSIKEKKCWDMSYQWLLTRLKTVPKSINRWCTVEFFLFIDNWLDNLTPFISFRNYEDIKGELNMDALKLIETIDFMDFSSTHQLNRWIMITSVANWFDVVIKDLTIKKVEALDEIQNILLSQKMFEDCNPVVSYLRDQKRNIVYECDNTGEIIFDLVLISMLINQGHCVTIVAKSGPILNDVTVDEVIDIINKNQFFKNLKINIDNGALSIISANNFPMVGKYLPLVTTEYKNIISECDVIWLKGQGNFQTMPILNHTIKRKKVNYKKRIIFNFVVKSPTIQYNLQQICRKKVEIGSPFIKLI